MAGSPRRLLGVIAAAGLMTLGLTTAASVPALATTGVTQAGPFEVGNYLDYANSDFEGTTGDWVSVSNATLTDDTAHAFLHGGALLDTVPAAGTSTFKLGNAATAVQIPVTAGSTYTVGAYFRIPAVTGQSLTFGLGFFNAAGTWLGWQRTGPLSLSGSGQWQYLSGSVTAPATAASVIGSPEVTYTGATTGETINMDEAAFVPKRAAQIIGAHGPSTTGKYTAANWLTANSSIGPLQSDKQFFNPSTPMPSTWASTDNNCYEIEQSIANPADWPACVISYLDQQANLQGFLAGMPVAQQVIFTWWQEPENDTFSGCPGAAAGNGPNFVCYFVAQASRIRAAAAAVGRTAEVFVAADAQSYMYSNDPSHNNGTNCSFTPPSSSVDFYLIDHYDQNVDKQGQNLPAEEAPYSDQWNNWSSCVHGAGKPIGIAEYGLNCTTSPNSANVTSAIAADSSYLAAIPGANSPTVLWTYWWSPHGFAGQGCQFSNSFNAVTTWQAAETQNGGG
jgi:hypothetical protein